MTFITTMLLFAFLQVQTYCLNFYSCCHSLFSFSVPLWAACPSAMPTLFWAMIIFLFVYVASHEACLARLLAGCVPVGYKGGSRMLRRGVSRKGNRFLMSKCGETETDEIIIPVERNSKPPEDIATEGEMAEEDKSPVTLSHILLVVADKELCDCLSERLEDDYRVTVLAEAGEIFSFCGNNMPDAIVIDETVNGTAGEKLCARLKSNALLNDIPLILLADYEDDAKYIDLLKCGAERVELRSVSVSRFKADIRALIKHRLLRYKRIPVLLANHFEYIYKKSEKRKAKPTFQEQLWKVLGENLSKDHYSIPKLCSDMAMSRTSFYNKMKKLTGLAPEVYVFMFKMEKAKILLATKEYNVSEVAGMTGFCNAKYFGKKFKKLYHISPTEYVKSIT